RSFITKRHFLTLAPRAWFVPEVFIQASCHSRLRESSSQEKTLEDYPETLGLGMDWRNGLSTRQSLMQTPYFQPSASRHITTMCAASSAPPLTRVMPNKSINFAPTAPDAAKLRRLLRR